MKNMQHKETIKDGNRGMGKPMGASVQSGLSASMSMGDLANRKFGDAECAKSSSPGTAAAGYMRESKRAVSGNVAGGFKLDGGTK